VFIIFFTFAVFASAILVNKALLEFLPPMLFVGIRMSISGFILLVATWGKHRILLYQLAQDWLIVSGIAFFTTFVPSFLKAYAYSQISAAQATLLGSIDPFITALYAYFLFGERLSMAKFFGMLIGFSGIALSLNLHQPATIVCSASTLAPQAAALAAVAFSRWGWLMVQAQLRKNRYPPAQLNGLVMFESGIIALSLSPWVDPFKAILIPSWQHFLLLMAYTVIIGNVIGYTLYAHLLKQYNATLVSLAGISIPIFVSIYSWLFLKEQITFRFVMATAIFFAGLTIFYYDDLKKRRSKKV
jgi:drug/metabolite transporter (DMT)-like permease